jgi:hypothetical protein
MLFPQPEALSASQLKEVWIWLAPYMPGAGAWFAFSLYLPLYRRTKAGTTPMNIATFLLWAVLDSILTASTFLQGGNFLLPLLFAFGAMAMVHAIRHSGVWEWKWKEWMATIFVAGSILVWCRAGTELAIVVAASGSFAGGLPMLFSNWKNPREAPLDLYFGFLFGNALSLSTLTIGTRFTVEGHFFGAIGTVLTAGFVLAALRRWLPAHRLQSANT